MEDSTKNPRRLGLKLAGAAVGAGALLTFFVLPAEYGIDPTGGGRAMGITALSGLVSPAAAADFGQNLSFNIEKYDLDAAVLNQSIRGLLNLQDAPFKSETITIDIEDLGEVEHKFIMKQDETLLYSWRVLNATGQGVYYDFHGHPSSADAPSYPAGFEQAYSKGEGVGQSGAFTAPFPGYHGFYFMNLEEGPIQIELTISGFFEEHKEMYRAVDGQVITKVAF
ncbi:hypothetical protein ACEN2J_08480 [Pseudorhodobacter sp. W20_MBD10_FR17]|uniref:hypothetical protein n=1 Tax=Pseudorhodobacter sp. W20_MBD10_FR17 TaxID=3240266 RepID=UPI003F955430